MDERLPLASIILFDREKKPKVGFWKQGERVSKEAMEATREFVRKSEAIIGKATLEELGEGRNLFPRLRAENHLFLRALEAAAEQKEERK